MAKAPGSKCEMIRFHLDVISVSLSLFLSKHLVDVVSWQSVYEHGREAFIILQTKEL